MAASKLEKPVSSREPVGSARRLLPDEESPSPPASSPNTLSMRANLPQKQSGKAGQSMSSGTEGETQAPVGVGMRTTRRSAAESHTATPQASAQKGLGPWTVRCRRRARGGGRELSVLDLRASQAGGRAHGHQSVPGAGGERCRGEALSVRHVRPTLSTLSTLPPLATLTLPTVGSP